ncbi:squalene/phytoene synthase family protein [Caulobacter sp. KR2-114]|uniref:squalene/phytoene synthase family protein n=1 Tax=Caulobacter sp. KR2-114 TaxID=3400912 RepID=UPI003C12333C
MADHAHHDHDHGPAPEGLDDLDDLDDIVRRGDPDRWLASRLIADPAARADVIALLAFDLELARAPRRASNALIGEIRLTWWREALDEIFGEGPVRRHPTALALAEVARRHRLAREDLEGLIDARYVELDKRLLEPAELAAWARGTAGAVARLSARMLDPGGPSDAAAAAGAAWALGQAGRIGLAEAGAAKAASRQALAEHRRAPRASPASFPAAAHAALAARSPGEGGAFGRQARLLWATLRGRV